MITLEKLLTELKAESLNEIVAGGGCGKGGGKGGNKGGGKGGHGKSGKSHSSKSTKSAKSASSRSYGCYTPAPAPCACTPGRGGCQ